ncbi:unnamed protein product [Trichobilharzia szidati]|nr:unnamed protein product [Trichobilharzia szidati]
MLLIRLLPLLLLLSSIIDGQIIISICLLDVQNSLCQQMDWNHGSHLNPTHSSLSLQLENGSFLVSDTYTDNIQLDDLAAPNHGCLCFKLPPIRLKSRRLHHFYKESQSSETLEPVFSGNILSDNQNTLTSKHTRNPRKGHRHDHHQQQKHKIAVSCLPSELSSDQLTQQLRQENSTNKNSISSIKLEVPVLPFTANQPGQDDTEMKQNSQTTPNKVQVAMKRLYKQHNWKCIPTRKQNTGQLKHLIWQIMWCFFTTILVSVSFVSFIHCIPNIYVSSHWNSSNFQELVNPPSLASYSISFWLILIYPVHLIFTLLFRLETTNLNEMIMHHALTVASDQPKLMKVIARCSLLSSLWQIFIHCYIRSLRIVAPVDCAAITAVLPCFIYLLSWIIVHRRFCALRVIAFIMASSGVILNIYSDQIVMWYKCLTSLAIITFSLFTVILKRISNKPSFGQMACFYFALGLFNILVTWPIFVFTSILTSTEIITWKYLPWEYFIGIGVSYLSITISIDLSSRKSKRVIRAIQPLCALSICIAYELFWTHQKFIMSSVQISSLVLITIACLLNAFPTSWQKHIAKLLRKNRSPKSQPTTSKRSITLAQRSKTSVVMQSTGSTPVSSIQRTSLVTPSSTTMQTGVHNTVVSTTSIRPLSAESIQRGSIIHLIKGKS